MADETRDNLLETAKRLFASKGFYGASLANIAEELGLTKQALLHHFGSKEKLYGEVLQQISVRMQTAVAAVVASEQHPQDQLEATLLDLYQRCLDHPYDVQIVVRELLDSERRAKEVNSWYLKPFLDELVAIIRSIPGCDKMSHRQALSLVYPLLGSMNYLVVSAVVLQQMYGAKTYEHMCRQYPLQMKEQIRSLLDAV